MKKIMISLLFTMILSASLFAQRAMYEVKFGTLFPQDTETGLILGLGYGQMVDENISWSFEADYFWRTYTKESTVEVTTGPATTTTVVTEIENATKMLPVLGRITYLTQVAPNLDLRISGGLGYAFLWNSASNYETNTEESDFFSGFAWELGAGLSIPISRAADFYGEFNYFGSVPSKDEGETVEGLPKRTEIDMSGLMLRIGIRLYN